MGSNPSCCQEEPATEVIQPEILHCRADHPDDHAGDHADSQKGPKDHESNELVVQDAHTTGSEEVSRPPSKKSRLQKMGHLVVDWEILRGIDLRETFVRRGSLWRSSPMDLPLERREQLWHLSRPVDGFDIFLSHTWLTAGKWKILALVLQSSWKTGLSCWGGSVCLALLLCAMDILPMPGLVYVDTAGFKATCPLGAWIVVFGFFGTIFGVVLSVYTPRWWSSSGTCFFDVVSIHQTDPVLMERGIYGLGGFLTVARELRVLWSPPYLSRLWCVFELAAYRTANPAGKITMAPLFIEVCMVILWASSTLGSLFYQLSTVARYSQRVSVPAFILGTMPAVLAFHLLRRFSLQRRSLLEDLSQFDVRAAECRSEFDKEFIYAAITEWYGTPEKFSSYVRGPLREELIFSIHQSSAPVAYTLLVTTPLVGAGLENCLGMWKGGAPEISLVTQLVGNVITLDIVWYLIAVQVGMFLCDYFTPKGRGCREYMKTLLICLIFGLVIVVGEAISSAACSGGLVPAMVFLGFTTLPICCAVYFAKRLLRYRAGATPESDPADPGS